MEFKMFEYNSTFKGGILRIPKSKSDLKKNDNFRL